MPNIWVISPGYYSNRTLFDRACQYDRENGTIAVGWGRMGDLSGSSEQDIQDRHNECLPHKSAQDRREIVTFWCKITSDDMVVARAGRKRVANVGYVRGGPAYDPQRGAHRLGSEVPNDTVLEYSASFLPVHWTNQEQDFGEIVFNMSTVCRLGQNSRVWDWIQQWFTIPTSILDVYLRSRRE